MSAPDGPLRGYEVAFMRRGHVLVRDHGNRLVLMWLTASREITPSSPAPGQESSDG